MKRINRKSAETKFSMCVQPAFIIGTNNEDGSHNFAPITWVSVTCCGKSCGKDWRFPGIDNK